MAYHSQGRKYLAAMGIEPPQPKSVAGIRDFRTAYNKRKFHDQDSDSDSVSVSSFTISECGLLNQRWMKTKEVKLARPDLTSSKICVKKQETCLPKGEDNLKNLQTSVTVGDIASSFSTSGCEGLKSSGQLKTKEVKLIRPDLTLPKFHVKEQETCLPKGEDNFKNLQTSVSVGDIASSFVTSGCEGPNSSGQPKTKEVKLIRPDLRSTKVPVNEQETCLSIREDNFKYLQQSVTVGEIGSSVAASECEDLSSSSQLTAKEIARPVQSTHQSRTSPQVPASQREKIHLVAYSSSSSTSPVTSPVVKLPVTVDFSPQDDQSHKSVEKVQQWLSQTKNKPSASGREDLPGPVENMWPSDSVTPEDLGCKATAKSGFSVCKNLFPVGHNEQAADLVTPEDLNDPKIPKSGLAVKKRLFLESDGDVGISTPGCTAPLSHCPTLNTTIQLSDLESANFDFSDGAVIFPLDDPLEPGNVVVVECITEARAEDFDSFLEETSSHAGPSDDLILATGNENLDTSLEGGDAPQHDEPPQLLQLDDTSLENRTPAKDQPEPADTTPGLPEFEVVATLDKDNNTSKRKRSVYNVKPLSRKRSVNQSKWKANEAKIAYNSGKAHVSLRGKAVNARSMKKGCAASCKRSCQAKISEEKRQALFDQYWGLGAKATQWFYLSKLVIPAQIERRRVQVEDEPFRKQTYKYYLRDLTKTTDNMIQVCQTMFVETFDISVAVVKTALLKNSPDKRGKHFQRRRISLALIQSVKDHIKEFPIVDSHYCRADTQKKYLDENLNIAKMHRMYVVERGEGSPDTASLRQYRDIFNNSFNLGFFKPKKDQCADCNNFKCMSDEEKRNNPQKVQAHNQHIRAKDVVRTLRRADKERSRDKDAMAVTGENVRVITFDLQKILYCPKSEVGELFYKRKLSCFNLTVFDSTTKEGICYVWDLSTGRKGADEILSAVGNYIERKVEEGVTEINAYTDNCTPQNKNKFLYTMYYFKVMKHKIKIRHRYLEKGHTQMECDNVHARIEKKTKNLQIYTPAQWYANIRCAKVNKPHYDVRELDQKTIYSYREVASSHFDWSKLPIQSIKEITFDSSTPGMVSYRTDFDKDCIQRNVLSKKAPGRPINWATYKPKLAYSGRLALKPKLIKDLKWYMQKNLIPAIHLPYYNKVTAPLPADAPVVDESSDEDDTPQEISQAPGALENLLDQAAAIDDEDENNEDDPPEPPNNEEDDGATTDSETFD